MDKMNISDMAMQFAYDTMKNAFDAPKILPTTIDDYNELFKDIYVYYYNLIAEMRQLDPSTGEQREPTKIERA